jgi:hypothetical protein
MVIYTRFFCSLLPSDSSRAALTYNSHTARTRKFTLLHMHTLVHTRAHLNYHTFTRSFLHTPFRLLAHPTIGPPKQIRVVNAFRHALDARYDASSLDRRSFSSVQSFPSLHTRNRKPTSYDRLDGNVNNLNSIEAAI